MADRKLIAIDIDDVLADTTEAIRLWGNAKSGVEITKEKFNSPGEYWGYYERVWAQHGVAEVLEFTEVERAMIEDEVKVPLLAGVSFAIKELLNSYNVVLITSRDPKMEEATHRWVEEHFPGQKIEIYFSHNVRNKKNEDKTKGQLCVQLGAFLLIDDNILHCQSALDAGVEAILFGDYGWQENVPLQLERCKDWPSVLEAVNSR